MKTYTVKLIDGQTILFRAYDFRQIGDTAYFYGRDYHTIIKWFEKVDYVEEGEA